MVDSYEYYGDNFDDCDSDANKRGSSSSGVQAHAQDKSREKGKKGNSAKKTNIEVLDEERPLEQYYEHKNNNNPRKSHQRES